MSSRSEEILTAIADGATTEIEPRCRKEQFLKAIANGDATNLPNPTCREEELLLQIAQNGVSGETNSSVTIITEYIDESSLPQNPKENDVCILNMAGLRTWVYQNDVWVEYPVIVEEEANEAGGVTLTITNNAVTETLNDAGGTTLTIGG